MPGNRQAWAAWTACRTQWRVASGGMGLELVGLDYQAARLVARTLGIAWSRDLLRKLRLLESEELRAWRAPSDGEETA